MQRNSLEQMVNILGQLRITNTADAMRVMPLVVGLLNQVQTVLARTARNEVLAASREKVFERMKAGEVKPSKLPEPDAPVEETPSIETPQDLPFEDEEVSEEEAEKARAELLGTVEEDKPKKTSKKKD